MNGSAHGDGHGSAAAPTSPTRPHWLAFSAVTAAYLAVTVAESILAPALPLLADELGIGLSTAGVALGSLTGAIAVGNFAGGYVLARVGSRASLMSGLVLAATGCVAVAASTTATAFILAQVVIGLGAGAAFPAGLQAAGYHAGSSRRGLAMGLFGVAFSGGLIVAALLAAAGARFDWRLAFVAAAALCGVGVLTLLRTPLPPRQTHPAGGQRRPLREALGPPVVAAGIAAIGQYGTVGFLPTFAVLSWGMSPAAAAVLLAAGRAASVPAKILGGLAADRWGPRATLAALGALLTSTGLIWCLLPAGPLVVVAAVVFTGTVSAVFPIANVLALDGFGDRGPLIGTFRSTQIGIGAGGAWLLGSASAVLGLTPTLTATVLLPLVLIVLKPTQARA